jgi:hypothetical protein
MPDSWILQKEGETKASMAQIKFKVDAMEFVFHGNTKTLHRTNQAIPAHHQYP